MSSATTNATEFFKRASSVAEHYGFRALSEIPKQKVSVLNRPQSKDAATFVPIRPHERSFTAFTRTAFRQGLDFRRTPTFVYRSVPSQKSTSEGAHHVFELHALGIRSVIAEAMLISASYALARELHLEDPLVRINSIGGAESRARFLRDVHTFFKRNNDQLPSHLRFENGCDALGNLVKVVDKNHALISKIPNSMEYLNEEERRHFSEILEYLEINCIPYELAPHVVGASGHWNNTLFEIISEGKIYARGGRYDPLVVREVGDGAAASGVAFMWKATGNSTPKDRPANYPKPQIYFAHLGAEAKRRAIGVLESLRQAGVPVYQSLAYEHMTEQMKEAQRLDTPYVLIMGHKEAMDGTVLLREIKTNAQTSIPLPELTSYLRRRRFALTK